jgi:hypothetical protein
MLKKNSEVKWKNEAKVLFQCIKRVIIEAPVLASLDYTKKFLIFYFSSEHTIAVVLLHKNEEVFERPIAFFSKSLRDTELKYDILEKQAYAMVKALKDFRTYVLHSKIIAYVPSSSIKDILVQLDNDRRRGIWLAIIQEFDLEVKVTKLIKGRSLAKLVAKSNLKELGINQLQENEGFLEIDEFDVTAPTTEIQDKLSSSV